MRMILVALLAACIIMTAAVSFGKGHTPEERGKKLFNDPAFAGGSKSCNTCHPDGRGLQKSGMKTNFNPEARTLEEMVNFCIRNANKGKPIPLDSPMMKDIVSYIRSIGGMAPPAKSSPAKPSAPPKGMR